MGKPHGPYQNSKLPGANFAIFAQKSKFRKIRRRLSHSMRNDLTKTNFGAPRSNFDFFLLDFFVALGFVVLRLGNEGVVAGFGGSMVCGWVLGNQVVMADVY